LQEYLLALAGKLEALLADSNFCDWLQQSVQTKPDYVLPNSDISILRSADKDQLFENGQRLLDIEWMGSFVPSQSSETQKTLLPGIADYQAYIDQLNWLAEQRKGFLLVEHILLLSSDNKSNTGLSRELTDAYYLTASFIFPSYIALFQQENFQKFIHRLLESHWPAHVEMRYAPTTHNQLKKIISAFVAWHNCLLEPNALNTIGQKKSTLALINLLNLPLEQQS
jgi:hypothetical protein